MFKIRSKKFSRCIEDFVCEHCGTKVKGSGYTNHCPNCLWSKHVDINPGDRLHPCNGLMKPIDIEISGKKGYIIVHQCQKCGETKRNKVAKDDNMDVVIDLMKNINKVSER